MSKQDMGKIIDSLQKRFGTTVEPEASASATAVHPDRAARQQVHEQLADVYFQNPKIGAEDPQASFHAPTVIRVVDRSRSYFLPWLITLIALALSAFALFSTKRIAIDVRVMDAAVPQSPAPGSDYPAPSAYRPLREVLKLDPSDFIFSGAALLRSSRDKEQLVLNNSTVSGLAYATVVFSPSYPALGNRLYFEARGLKGGEKIELVFKDSNGNTSLNWKSLIPFEDGLTTAWQSAVIDLEPTRFFNPTEIQQLRIEFGSQRTGNTADATILVRNMQWVPAEIDPS